MAAGLAPGAVEFAELGFTELAEFRSGVGLGFEVLIVGSLGLALRGVSDFKSKRVEIAYSKNRSRFSGFTSMK